MNMEKQADARAARREYMRRWRADHPEAVKAAQERYWSKKAEQMRTVGIQQDETEIIREE